MVSSWDAVIFLSVQLAYQHCLRGVAIRFHRQRKPTVERETRESV